MSATALDILTRDRVCLACDASDYVGAGEYLTCEHVTDDLGQPITCRLRGMLADPRARCPHPDPAQARRWNEAAVVAGKGCGGAARRTATAPRTASTLTLRVRACLGHDDVSQCEHADDGWVCAMVGRSIAKDLKNPAFACPIGRFGAEGGKA